MKAMALSLCALGMILFGGTNVVLAENQRKIVLTENQFKESFLEKVSVSGGIRAGFMHKSTLERVDVHKLFIYLHHDLEDQDAMLCVNMVSRDGRYTAAWNFGIGKQSTGAINVELPSKYREQISSYHPDALAVLAGITKQNCSAPDIKYIPASWGEAQHSDYVLYVNSSNTDTVIGIPGQAERIPCTKIAAESTIAYDTQCTVGKDVLSEPKSIFFVRTSFGNRLPNVEFPVR